MCGVCGVFRAAGREGVGFAELDAMAAALRHRGPDNTSVHVAGRIGVAHTRLALLDLSERGNQPFRNERYSLIHSGVHTSLENIRGMFAFAFVDHDEQRIVLARDRVGIKPLFHGMFDGDVYFASELKALRSVLDLVPNPNALTEAVFNTLERSRTVTAFEGVRQVEPGSYVEIDGFGHVRTEHYFNTIDLVDRDLYRELDAMPEDRVLD